jgi:lipoprotein-anchoring transpeptidase ErfK/SrfK
MRLIDNAGVTLAVLASALGLAACSPGQTTPPARPAPPVAAAPALGAPGLSPEAINAAALTPIAAPVAAVAPPASAPAAPVAVADPPPDAVLIRAEVLLDRARFSPGVIDGKAGTNARHALTAFQAHAGLPATGDLDPATWSALTRDAAPVVNTYVISQADVAGPYAPDVGEDFVKLAALPMGPLYTGPLEALAERFHMSQSLLAALNPGADFARAGTRLIVAAPGAPPLAKGQVARVEVSKAKALVTAYGADDAVLAVYPATVGSTERPSPSGAHKVNGIANDTPYVYDPRKLNWGPRSHGKLTIKPGPNGPVGVVWIDLNAPSYGIHGTPDPDKIGKTASHGCVRLTNWDAQALADGVAPGVAVTFVGARGKG